MVAAVMEKEVERGDRAEVREEKVKGEEVAVED